MDENEIIKLGQFKTLNFLLVEKNFINGFPYFNENFRERRKLFQTKICFSLMALIMFRDFVSYFIREDFYSVLIGDFVFKFKFKIQWNICIALCSVLLTSIQLINDYNYKKYRNFIQLFQTDFRDFNNSLNCFKLFEKFLQFLLFIFYFVLSLLFFWPYITFTQLMTIGLFWSLLYGLFVQIFGEKIFWNLFLFELICCELIFGLKKQNKVIESMFERQTIVNSFEVNHLLRDIDSNHRKISAQNEIWSNVLFVEWILLSLINVTCAIPLIFGDSDNTLIKTVFLCSSIMCVVGIVLPILLLSVLLYLESKNTYKLLLRLMANPKARITSKIRIKVNLSKFFRSFFLFFQLMSFIERIAKLRVGFYCGNLFIINEIKCYEVSLF